MTCFPMGNGQQSGMPATAMLNGCWLQPKLLSHHMQETADNDEAAVNEIIFSALVVGY